MKYFYTIILLFVAFSVFAQTEQQKKHRAYGDGEIGAFMWLSEKPVYLNSGAFDARLKASAGYAYKDLFSVGIGLEYLKTNADFSDNILPSNRKVGEMEILNFFSQIKYYAFQSEKIKPYVVVNIGMTDPFEQNDKTYDFWRKGLYLGGGIGAEKPLSSQTSAYIALTFFNANLVQAYPIENNIIDYSTLETTIHKLSGISFSIGLSFK